MSARDYSPDADIAAALTFIPPHDRDTWVRMAMAIKSELGEAGFLIWDNWSQAANSYHAKSAKAVWKGIKAGGKVSIASLFHEAIKNGWQPSKPYTPPTAEQRAALEAERQAAAEAAAEIERQQREAAKAKAARLWNEAHDVAADHPYPIAKGIKPEGVKQLRQMLVLPIRSGGELVNLQLIGEDGSKRFLTGGQVKGASLVLGKLAGAAEAILCEGWATGLSLRAATGLPVVVAFNAGNLPVIAERLFRSLPELAPIVAGDTDESQTGQKAAHQAATVHGKARRCCPTFTPEQADQYRQQHGKAPSDFNDLHQLAGLEEVARQVGDALLANVSASDGEDLGKLVAADLINPEITVALPESENVLDSGGFSGVTKKAGNNGNNGNNEHFQRLNLEKTGNKSGNKSQKLGTNEENARNGEKPGEDSTVEKPPRPAFFVTRAGVYWCDPSNDDAAPIWICSPLWVEAETRDANQSNWGRLLRWFDNDGREHYWACPAAMLVASDTAEFRKVLADQGLTIAASPRARSKIVDYVLTAKPLQSDRARCVVKIGWHGERYVLPGKSYGKTEGESVIYQGGDTGDFIQSGTLGDWQREIAARAAGNSRLVFFVAASFAGALLDLAGDHGGGFHLCGKTSGGKSTSLLAAASVWGNPDKFRHLWRSTTNGLESLCASRNHNVLILDELGQIDPRDAGTAAYTISNGHAKVRMSKEGANRPTATWATMLLSAGEIDLTQHMAEAGKSAKGGQQVRLPAIPADAGAGMGVFENIHSSASAKEFADQIKEGAGKAYGVAGDAFLAALAEPESLDGERGAIRLRIDAIAKTFDIPKQAAPEVGRVAARFALVAYAGELATRYGVTGWQPMESVNAAKKCFSDWIAEHGGELGADDRALFSQVRAFIEAHGSSRFPPHDADPDALQRFGNRAGFSRADHVGIGYMVLPEVFKRELCKGFNPKAAIKTLIRAGWMEAGHAGRDSQKVRIKALSGNPASVYVLTPAVLEGEQ